jgi:uncharacterized membrane protein (UPF0127 family)
MKNILKILLICILAASPFALPACSQAETKQTATVKDYLTLEINGIRIRAQIAITGPEQEKGLMYCKSLPEGYGMLFAYKEPQEMCYWMNHVPIPLTIGFFRPDGTLDEVRRMLPNDKRSIVSSSKNIQYCLEMNENWYARNGVTPGMKLDMELVKKALAARGEESSRYGLK